MSNLPNLPGLQLYPDSVVTNAGTTYFLARAPEGKRLGIQGDTSGFDGEQVAGAVLLCPLTAHNAAALRARLPWLVPGLLGLQPSFGAGDRLGLATPGHIQALRARPGLAPILAQQSMRENARTSRTPQGVIDDAVWGAFQMGWRDPWGADADHLKTPDHIDVCIAAGYTFFTIDPGDHVDNEAHTAPLDVLRQKLAALPWEALEDTPDGLRARYLSQDFTVEDLTLAFDEESLLRAAGKYGAAIAHTTRMYRHLRDVAQGRPFELEVSVDETETPTAPLEHFFVVSELKRLGVEWVSLAPRYSGRFEKGVDFIGDLAAFEAEIIQHAAIAREMGPYKLSLHSGSDKFSIYPIIARHTGPLLHVKTAGTSYLEALRAVAGVDPDLFRAILVLAHERYATDRATYHVSADAAKVPPPESLADEELASMLDSFDARQMLHVTFGSALERYGDALKAALNAHEETHYQTLEAHFIRHLAPFCG
ncbi:MAG: hypothetical protein JXN59_02825 [Anaerolineae bacterium]|nr:hypothetical protein [Anaerolineae bacterium]